MKRKIGTLIDERIIKLAKHRATDEGCPLSEIIQDALVAYLSKATPDPSKRESAYRIFCETPIKLNKKQFQKIIEGDL